MRRDPEQAVDASVKIARPGGAVLGRIGVPHYEAVPGGRLTFLMTLASPRGPAPTRFFVAGKLLPEVMEGRRRAGHVFDRAVDLEVCRTGHRAMNKREALKVMGCAPDPSISPLCGIHRGRRRATARRRPGLSCR